MLRVLDALLAPANSLTPRVLSSLVSLLPTVFCWCQPLFLSTLGFEEENLFPHCHDVSLHFNNSLTPSSLSRLLHPSLLRYFVPMFAKNLHAQASRGLALANAYRGSAYRWDRI